MSFRGFLAREQFDTLFDALNRLGARCIGPTVKDGAICYSELSGSNQLPHKLKDLQAPGCYRLQPYDSPRWFAWANGPQALKPLTFSPKETLWESQRLDSGELDFRHTTPPKTLLAVLGVRACDLAALALQDQHFLGPHIQDMPYATRREGLILIAVNCTHPADTCFCHATGDGPEVRNGYDLLLDELEDGFAVRCNGERGEDIIRQLPLVPLAGAQENAVQKSLTQAASQPRKLPDIPLDRVLTAVQESTHWQSIAERCLSCGNCTSVCPTCFCHSQYDEPAADGLSSMHFRQWDSCFTQGHSYIHGLVIRDQTRFRYRQWLTHKFSYWISQYGRSGCVGCGRCISWCPVSIDVTEELNTLTEEYRHV